jgi:Rad3-related DNA helicase
MTVEEPDFVFGFQIWKTANISSETQTSRTPVCCSDGTMDYQFPFPPYSEQKKLMNDIYECIESSSVGCFESPTGTGKSLSAICASFTWLLKEEDAILTSNRHIENKVQMSVSTGDWLADMLASKSSASACSKSVPDLVRKYDETTKRIAQSNSRTSAGFSNTFFQRSIPRAVAAEQDLLSGGM